MGMVSSSGILSEAFVEDCAPSTLFVVSILSNSVAQGPNLNLNGCSGSGYLYIRSMKDIGRHSALITS